MILQCNYEEVSALTHGAHGYLEAGAGPEGGVAAPPVERQLIELFLDRLDGDVSVRTIEEQGELERAVDAIVEHLRSEVDLQVTIAHPAAEEAVAAYFDFAHALSVLSRLREIGEEMHAVVELISGSPPSARLAREFVFPD